MSAFDVDRTSTSIGGAINRAINSLFFSAESHERFHDAGGKLGLTPVMFKALLDLEPGTARSMRELATQWRCDASFVTVVVDGLEERGLVERRVLPSDRRVKTVQLTPLGVTERENAIAALSVPLSGLAALSGDEQEELARLLVKFAEAQAAADEVI